MGESGNDTAAGKAVYRAVARPALVHDAGFLQQGKVPRDRGLVHFGQFIEFAHAPVAPAQRLHQQYADGMSERLQYVCPDFCLFVVHGRKLYAYMRI